GADKRHLRRFRADAVAEVEVLQPGLLEPSGKRSAREVAAGCAGFERVEDALHDLPPPLEQVPLALAGNGTPGDQPGASEVGAVAVITHAGIDEDDLALPQDAIGGQEREREITVEGERPLGKTLWNR